MYLHTATINKIVTHTKLERKQQQQQQQQQYNNTYTHTYIT